MMMGEYLTIPSVVEEEKGAKMIECSVIGYNMHIRGTEFRRIRVPRALNTM